MNNTYLKSRELQIKPLMDKLANLKMEISTLQNQKNLSESELIESQTLLHSIDQAVKVLDEQFSISAKEVDDFIEFTKEVLSNGLKYIKETENIVSQYMIVVEALNTKIENSRLELVKIQTEKNKALEYLQEEEKRLSSKKRDLDIYKERLQAKAMELGVNIVIRF